MSKYIVVLILALSSLSFAQKKDKVKAPDSPPTSQVQPPSAPPGSLVISKQDQTEIESLLKDVIILQQQQQILQAQFSALQQQIQGASKAFNDRSEAIKKAHGWGVDVVFDPNTRTFVKQPTAPPAVPNVKK